MRVLPVAAAAGVAVALTVAGCGGSSTPSSGHTSPATPPASSATPASAGSLGSVALTAADASRYGGQPVTAGPPPAIALGSGLNATLDLCAATFPSEAMRVQRYQVSFVVAGNPRQVAESNEIVRYRPGGTTRAYSEAVAAARRCRAMSQNGLRVSEPTIEPRSRQLVSEQLTVAFSETRAAQTTYNVSVYQYRGDLFDGIYVTRGSARDALDAARKLAALAAQKLRTAASAS